MAPWPGQISRVTGHPCLVPRFTANFPEVTPATLTEADKSVEELYMEKARPKLILQSKANRLTQLRESNALSISANSRAASSRIGLVLAFLIVFMAQRY